MPVARGPFRAGIAPLLAAERMAGGITSLGPGTMPLYALREKGLFEFGAQKDYLARQALRPFGIEPIKGAPILQIESTPARYAAMKAGAVDATIMWFPQTPVAEAGYRGFSRSLAADGDIPAEGIEFLVAEEPRAGNLRERHAATDPMDTTSIEQLARAQVTAFDGSTVRRGVGGSGAGKWFGRS